MNNNQLFDEHIKDQFSDYAPDVPPRVWENIMAEKEKRRPAGFWVSFFNTRNMLVLLGLLLAGGTGAWLIFKKPTSSPAEKNTTQSPVEKNTLTPAGPSASTENKLVSTENKNDAPVTTNNNNGNNVTTEPLAVSLPNQQNNTPANIPSRDFKSGKTTAFSSLRIHSPSLQSDANEDPGAYNKKTAGISGNTNKDNSKTKDGDLSIDDNMLTQGSMLGRLMYGAQVITATKKQSEELKTHALFGFLPGCPAFEKDAAGNKKYIELYAGPDIAMRNLSDTGNSTYLQKRKESSKVSSAYSAGIRYTKVFNNSMSLRTGINYSQINEKFTFVQGNLVQITYIINANGDTTGSYITTGTRYKTTHNKYRSIDVPLLVGYEIGNGRLHANINAGVVVNVYSWQKGEVLDTTFQPVIITTGKGSSPYQFKTNAGVGFMSGVSLYYKLNDKVHVMVEPYFRHNFTPMNKDNLTIKQKYNTAGLRLGLRVDLK